MLISSATVSCHVLGSVCWNTYTVSGPQKSPKRDILANQHITYNQNDPAILIKNGKKPILRLSNLFLDILYNLMLLNATYCVHFKH